jgi:hypothetical protein
VALPSYKSRTHASTTHAMRAARAARVAREETCDATSDVLRDAPRDVWRDA